MLTEFVLKEASHGLVQLHEYYMTKSNIGQMSIIVQYKHRHFLSDTKYFLIGFSDLYDLLNISELDVSLLRSLALYMQKQTSLIKGKGGGPAFADLGLLARNIIDSDRGYVIQQMLKAIFHYADRDIVVCLYNLLDPCCLLSEDELCVVFGPKEAKRYKGHAKNT